MSTIVELGPTGPSELDDDLRDVLRRAIPSAKGDPNGLSQTLARLDLYGLLVASELGGVGAGLSSALVVVEELAAAGAWDHYAHTAVLAPMVLRHVHPGPRIEHLLRDLATGRRRALVLVDGVVDDRHLPEALPSGSGPVLSGRGAPLPDDGTADVLVVAFRDGHRTHLAVLPATAPGIAWEPVRDLTGRPRRRVVLRGVQLDAGPTAVLGPVELDEIASVGALVQTAALVGAAGRSRDLTLDHVRSRQQFGRPLAAFQAVQMRCADLAGDVGSAQAILRRATAAFDAGRESRDLLASMAVLWSAPACVRATQTAHLLHGALGFTAEYELHRHSVTALAAGLGANASRFHQSRVAGRILQHPSDWSLS